MKNLLLLSFFFGLINTSSAQVSDWQLAGNMGTTSTTDFVGTTDLMDLRFRTDNTFRFGVTAAGRFGLNTTAPDMLLHVDGGGLLVSGNQSYMVAW
jgi:hypothetical protein